MSTFCLSAISTGCQQLKTFHTPQVSSLVSLFNRHLSSSAQAATPWKKYPTAKALSFSYPQIHVQQDLIIGARLLSASNFELLAYHQQGHMAWHCPLDRSVISWQSTPQGLAIMQAKQANYTLLNPLTGTTVSQCSLPRIPHTLLNQLHISKSGHCFYLSSFLGRGVLHRKHPDQEQWESQAVPKGIFQPLGDYAGFMDKSSNQVTVVDSLGHTQTFLSCREIQAHQNKIYAIQEVEGKSFGIAVPQTGLLSRPELSQLRVPIELRSLKLLAVSDQGMMICSQMIDRFRRLVFVDTVQQTVVVSPHSLYLFSKLVIDTSRGAVWTWDVMSQMVDKHTADGKERVGKLEGGRDTYPLHVDKHERLYSMNYSCW